MALTQKPIMAARIVSNYKELIKKTKALEKEIADLQEKSNSQSKKMSELQASKAEAETAKENAKTRYFEGMADASAFDIASENAAIAKVKEAQCQELLDAANSLIAQKQNMLANLRESLSKTAKEVWGLIYDEKEKELIQKAAPLVEKLFCIGRMAGKIALEGSVFPILERCFPRPPKSVIEKYGKELDAVFKNRLK